MVSEEKGAIGQGFRAEQQDGRHWERVRGLTYNADTWDAVSTLRRLRQHNVRLVLLQIHRLFLRRSCLRHDV